MKSSWRLSQSRKKGLWILFLILSLIIGFRWWVFIAHPSRPTLPSPPQHLLVEEVVSLDTLDINIASAEDFRQFRGIGKVLSERILKFRSVKGGFHDIGDIQMVYGIQDSVFQQMKPFLQLSTPFPQRKSSPIQLNKKPLPQRLLHHPSTSIWQIAQHGLLCRA